MFKLKSSCTSVASRTCTPPASIKQTKRLLSSSNAEWRTAFELLAKTRNTSVNNLRDIKHLDEKTSKIVQKEFQGSIQQALSTLFPELQLNSQNNTKTPSNRFLHRFPRGHWTEHANQRKFFDDLGKKIGIHSLDDWYAKASRGVILPQQGGTNVLKRHNGSPMAAIMAAYPEHNWIPWKFNVVTTGYWNSSQNIRQFFDWLGQQYGIKHLDDWYDKISRKMLEEHYASTVLNLNKGSPTHALMKAYPEHNWIPWKFKTTPVGFWNDMANRRKFFDYLGAKLQVQALDDWYAKLSSAVVAENGGLTLLQKVYNGSAIAAVMDVYPEHNWIPWKFHNVTRGCWDSTRNISQFLAELSEKLCIQSLEDWYRVDQKILHQFGATLVTAKFGGLYEFLKIQYPNYPWDRRKFHRSGKKAQRWLAVTLKKMFPNEEILEDYNHPKVLFTSGRPIQLDVFIPSKNLAFEYQGIQHYEDVGVFNPLKLYQQRDAEKRTLCASNNIKLIEVPYWWNRTQESLQEMIDQHASPLLQSHRQQQLSV